MARTFSRKKLEEINEAFRELTEEQDWIYIVADGNRAACNYIVHNLELLGCDVVVGVNNKRSAVARARGVRGKAIVFAEVDPPIDGITLLKNLRDDRVATATKVVLMSAATERSRIVAALKARPAGYLKKPFKPEGIAERLSQLGALPFRRRL